MIMENLIDLNSDNSVLKTSNNCDFIEFKDLQNSLKIKSKTLFKFYLKEVYKDLAEKDEKEKRKGISKLTFFEYFKIPIFIGESMFNALDKDRDGFLNLNEFEQGLTSLYLGNFKEAAQVIFNIYDNNLDGIIHKEDIRLTLSYLPLSNDSLAAYKEQLEAQEQIKDIVDSTFMGYSELNFYEYLKIVETKKSDSFVYLIVYLYGIKVFNHQNIESLEKKKELHCKITEASLLSIGPSSFSLDLRSPQLSCKIPNPKTDFLPSVTSYLNRKCKRSTYKTGRLTEENNDYDIFDHEISTIESSLQELLEYENLTGTHNRSSKHIEKNINNNIFTNASKIFDSPSNSLLSGITRRDTMVDDISKLSMDLAYELDFPFSLETEEQEQPLVEGWIYKLTETGKLKKFWLEVKNYDIMYYKNKNKDELSGMHSLAGCSVHDALPENISNKKLYSFVIKFKNKSRSYYCEDRDECFKWRNCIRKAIGFKCFFDYYEINEDIGRGKFGIVKLGKNKILNSKVAIKTIKKQNLKTKQDQELIKVEIDIMKLCTHPNVNRMFEHFENSEYIFIVMEYIQGGDLNKYVRNYYKGSKNNRLLPEDRVAELMKQLAEGLKYLHSYGIIHRDIKPDNIMMTDTSPSAKLKIMDFGLSKLMHYGEKVVDGFGTLSFVAPEVLQRKPYDFKVDVWSLGVTIFYLLSGDLPFDDIKDDENTIARKVTSSQPEFKSKIWDTISSEAKRVISKCLIKDKDKRITINEFLDSDWIKSRSDIPLS